MKHGLAIGEKKMLAIALLCRLSSVTQSGLVEYGYPQRIDIAQPKTPLKQAGLLLGFQEED
jgi:hypothetical protein